MRSGDLDREEAKALIHRYDGEFPERWANEIFKYLSVDAESFPQAHKMFKHPEMTREYFEALANNFRSPHLWQYDNGNWSLRRSVSKE